MKLENIPLELTINDRKFYLIDQDNPVKMNEYLKLYEYIIAHQEGVIV